MISSRSGFGGFPDGRCAGARCSRGITAAVRGGITAAVRGGITAAVIILILLSTAGCASYYDQHVDFQQRFLGGDYAGALKVLDEQGADEKKNRLLYLLDRGVTLHHLGRYEESNDTFEEAYLFIENARKQLVAQAASFLTNPNVVAYRGEDFEAVQIHYYKALNSLLLDRPQDALVECRRLNIRLNALNDRFKGSRIRYSTDAFALNLMGIIFESSGEINNAFISYRNAYEAYSDVYAKSFGLEPPLQLKRDLLRTASRNGFVDELQYYERELGMRYDEADEPDRDEGYLVVFWHNGLGPVKEEWSINFAAVQGDGGVAFVNRDMGLQFPFSFGDGNGGGGSLGDLKVVRVAFPRYRERPPRYAKASLIADGREVELEPAQDLNSIAFSSLEDRMLREFSTSLLRLALKQATEYMVRQQNEGLGALLSIFNAVTEQADTRNWQTLPRSISYARIPLPAGSREIDMRLAGSGGTAGRTDRLIAEVPAGGTAYLVHRTPLTAGR